MAPVQNDYSEHVDGVLYGQSQKGEIISILLDTSFLVAYFDRRDVNHPRALELLKSIEENEHEVAFISDYVFDETMILLKKYLGTRLAGEKREQLLCSSELILTDQEVFENAWLLFRKNEKLSFTDCTLVAQMKHPEIEEIVSFDSDFRGFVSVVY